MISKNTRTLATGINYPSYNPEIPKITSRSLVIVAILGGLAVPALASAKQPVERPLPSGTTCEERMNYYGIEQGVLPPNQVPVGASCSDPDKKIEVMKAIDGAEEAAKYLDMNPEGALAVAGKESSLDIQAQNGQYLGLFQHGKGLWPGRVATFRAYAASRYIDEKKRGLKTKPIKISGNIFDARSQMYVSMLMIRQGGLDAAWVSSRGWWGKKRSELTGAESHWVDFLNRAPYMSGIHVSIGRSEPRHKKK